MRAASVGGMIRTYGFLAGRSTRVDHSNELNMAKTSLP
jgi:hypothetical protein